MIIQIKNINKPPKRTKFLKSFSLSFLLPTFTLYLILAPSAHAGTIIKAPVYLGLSNGLVGYWTFDGADTHKSSSKTDDKSGNGLVGTLNSGPIIAEGKIGQSLDFFNNSVTVPNNSILLPSTDMTVTAWVYLDQLPSVRSAAAMIVYKSHASSPFESYDCEIDTGNKIGMNWYNTTPTLFTVSSTQTVPLGTWTFVTCLKSGSSLKLYQNGSEITTGAGTPSGTIFNSTAQLVLGNDSSNGTSNSMAGKIDDVRIYNRALSVTEIQRLYNIGVGSRLNHSSGNSVSSGDLFLNGIIGYWTFDGVDIHKNSNKTDDKSGNGIVGTLTNSPTIAEGKIGQALNFNSNVTNQEVDLGTPSALHNLNVRTISAWIYPRSLGGSNFGTVILSVTGGTNHWYIQMCSNDGTECSGAVNTFVWYADLATGAVGEWRAPANTIKFNQWQHIAISFDCTVVGNTPNIYYNGNLLITTQTRTPGGSTLCSQDSGDNVLIGSNGNGNATFDGLIDDVRMYNRGLSSAEIYRLYQQTQTKFNASKSNNTLLNGLVGYWTLDGADIHSSNNKTDDRSGTNKAGTLNNSPSIVEGRIGQGLNFKGGNNINVQTSSTIIGTGNLTMSAWIKLDAYNGNGADYIIMSTSGGNDKVHYAVDSVGGINALSLSDDNDATNSTSANGSIKLHQWYHALVTRTSGGTTNFYINGVRSGTANQSSGSPVASDTMYISDNNVDSFTGVIDDVRVYNRILGIEEIQKLYQMGK